MVLAGDTLPIEVYCHLPVMCEDRNLPYVYIPSKTVKNTRAPAPDLGRHWRRGSGIGFVGTGHCGKMQALQLRRMWMNPWLCWSLAQSPCWKLGIPALVDRGDEKGGVRPQVVL